jgi:cytochrome bd ubiquinol oxidase subunit I
LDVLLLSRLQFALTIMFHYLFPPLSIGLGLLLVALEGLYLKTGDKDYEKLARFFTKIFALNFALGVASGIVMEFQFGTNWATYSRYVGDVFGSALAAEGVFAFFLESGFLAVMVFGWDRVSPRTHFMATVLVALGATFSAVWIVVANSWQQTPAGYHLAGDPPRAEITDFWAMVFNPSSVHRLLHTLLGAYILGAFFVLSISAFYILRGRHVTLAKKAFTLALIFGLIASWLTLISGHAQAQAVAVNQPAKLAAFEGHFKSSTEGTPLYVVGFPDAEREEMRGVAVPGLLSLLVYGDSRKPVEALDQTPRKDRPPVVSSFVRYHLMVGLGFFFIGLTTLAAFWRWRGTLFEKRWLLWVFVFAVIGPYVANETGWFAAEVGRQPWIVYKQLRTADAFSKSVPAEHVMISIVLFLIVYALLFAVWLYLTNDKIQKGPDEPTGLPEATGPAGLLDAASRHAGAASYTEAQPPKDAANAEEKR